MVYAHLVESANTEARLFPLASYKKRIGNSRKPDNCVKWYLILLSTYIFSCRFSVEVWKGVKQLADMNHISDSWANIILQMQHFKLLILLLLVYKKCN